jgi:hypothetical protein
MGYDDRNSIFYPISITILFVMVLFFLSYLNDTGMGMVFLGLLPLGIFSIIISIFHNNKKLPITIILTPIILNIIFIYIWSLGTISIMEKIDIPQISVLNILLSYAILVLRPIYNAHTKIKNKLEKSFKDRNLKLYHSQLKENLWKKEKIRELNRKIEELNNQLESKENDIIPHLRNIEDKCKGINFVIGRVYSTRNGASKKLREKIIISRELYNRFSEISEQKDNLDKNELLKIMHDLLSSLTRLEKSEMELLGLEIKKLKRVTNGIAIIDVLAENDKDPVKDYYSEAKEICIRIISSITKTASTKKY